MNVFADDTNGASYRDRHIGMSGGGWQNGEIVRSLSLDHFTPAAFAAGDFITESPSYIIHISEGDFMARLLLLPPRNQIVFDAGSFTTLELESSNRSPQPARRPQLKHAPPMLEVAGRVQAELKTTDNEETFKRIADAVHLLRQWGRSHSSSKVA